MAVNTHCSGYIQNKLNHFNREIGVYLQPNSLLVSDPKIPFLVLSYLKVLHSKTFSHRGLLLSSYQMKLKGKKQGGRGG